MTATTIKVSVETRERIRAHGGATHEATILEALDALDAQNAESFWNEAERARAAYDSLAPEERDRIRSEYRTIDAALDSVR